MPQITISDASIRSWAQQRGLRVGLRGRLSKDTVDQYVRWHEMPLIRRIAELEREINELRAERSEDKAIIKAQQLRIESLERQRRNLELQRGQWRDAAISLAGAVDSSD